MDSEEEKSGAPQGTTPSTPQAREALRLAEARRVFLEQYAMHGEVALSARKAGIDRTTVYLWRDRDPVFKLEMEEAHQAFCARVHREIVRRAVDGIEVPLAVYRGEVTEWGREYSDGLLEKLASAHMPELYGQRSTVEVRMMALFARLDLTKCTDEQVTRLADGELPQQVFGVDPTAWPLKPDDPTAKREALPPGPAPA